MMRFQTTAFTLILVMLVVAPALSVFAQVVTPPVEITNPIGTTSITDILNALINFALLLLPPLSTLMVLWAGLLFMTAGANADRLAKARTALVWALVGIAVVLLSKGAQLIIADLLSVNGSPQSQSTSNNSTGVSGSDCVRSGTCNQSNNSNGFPNTDNPFGN